MSTEGFRDRWTEIELLFSDALALPPADRPSFLDEHCAGRPDVRAEVESLLQSHDRADDFLHVPTHAEIEPDGEDLTGHRIGAFTLLEPIGHGGMGVVYLAERAGGEFTQRVAIKIIDAPVHHSGMLQRFKAERQILASLGHPHIVRLIDGGVAESGHAYLAMEYVEGVPITTYCADRSLGLTDRLRLIQRVCGAIQYAHQHGVVHRDLKPANILVTGDGVPKILDFGIAKLLDPDTQSAEPTLTGLWRPLTPNYASPEQLRGLTVTTSSDIYALGVVCYEVIAGVRPYDTGEKPLDEILETVVNRDPRRPSAAAVGSLPYGRADLNGDLDAIVFKAMNKDAGLRYASARELSEDIERHLEGKPIIAREMSFGYQVSRLARRHRAAVGAAAVAILALLTALVVSLTETRIAVAERNRANDRFNDTRQLANALLVTIETAVQPLPGSTPVRRIIVNEALKYLERLSKDPASDDALRLELARGYHRVSDVQGNPSVPNLGDRAGALDSLHKAVAVLRPATTGAKASRDATVELGRIEIALATIALPFGAHEESRAALEDASRLAERLVQGDPTDAAALRLLGSVQFQMAMQSPAEEELAHWQRAGEVFNALLKERPDDPDRQRNVALVEKYIGAYYEKHQDYPTALLHHLRARELDERRLAAKPEDRLRQFDVAIDLSNVAYAQWSTGHLADAAAGYERSLAIRLALAEADPKDVLARSRVAFVESRLAVVYSNLHDSPRAIAHAREAVRLGESMAAIDSLHEVLLADDLQTLGVAEMDARHTTEACRAFRRSLDMATAVEKKAGTDANLAYRATRVIANDRRRLSQCPK